MYENKPMDVGAVDMVDEGTSDANADRTQKKEEAYDQTIPPDLKAR
jgi:hypothetical protein